MHRLKKLDLSGCGLTRFPERLKHCDSLEELNLSNSSLSSEELLSPILKRLPRLKKLYLCGCGLIRLPDDLLKQITELEFLNLSNNSIDCEHLLHDLRTRKYLYFKIEPMAIVFEDAVLTRADGGER